MSVWMQDLWEIRVTLIVGLPPKLTSFWIISSQISSSFLANSLFPPSPAGRLEQSKPPWNQMMFAMMKRNTKNRMMMIMRAGWIDMRGDHSGWRGGKGKGTPGAWKAKRERGKKMNILSTKAKWWIMHNEKCKANNSRWIYKVPKWTNQVMNYA